MSNNTGYPTKRHNKAVVTYLLPNAMYVCLCARELGNVSRSRARSDCRAVDSTRRVVLGNPICLWCLKTSSLVAFVFFFNVADFFLIQVFFVISV